MGRVTDVQPRGVGGCHHPWRVVVHKDQIRKIRNSSFCNLTWSWTTCGVHPCGVGGCHHPGRVVVHKDQIRQGLGRQAGCTPVGQGGAITPGGWWFIRIRFVRVTDGRQGAPPWGRGGLPSPREGVVDPLTSNSITTFFFIATSNQI